MFFNLLLTLENLDQNLTNPRFKGAGPDLEILNYPQITLCHIL